MDTTKGRQRLKAYLASGPFPQYQAHPEQAGLLIRIDEDGGRTSRRFVDQKFQAVKADAKVRAQYWICLSSEKLETRLTMSRLAHISHGGVRSENSLKRKLFDMSQMRSTVLLSPILRGRPPYISPQFGCLMFLPILWQKSAPSDRHQIAIQKGRRSRCGTNLNWVIHKGERLFTATK